jgi:hypothetical protein
MRIEWVGLDERIAAYDEEFAAFASLVSVAKPGLLSARRVISQQIWGWF